MTIKICFQIFNAPSSVFGVDLQPVRSGNTSAVLSTGVYDNHNFTDNYWDFSGAYTSGPNHGYHGYPHTPSSTHRLNQQDDNTTSTTNYRVTKKFHE